MNPALLENESETDEGGSSRRYDGELKRIAAIIRLLEEGDELSRSRVMTYLFDRYNGRSA